LFVQSAASVPLSRGETSPVQQVEIPGLARHQSQQQETI